MATISELYYDAGNPAVFSTLSKLQTAEAAERKKLKSQSVGAIKTWLEEQAAYTLQRPVSKRFARNNYTVSNLMDVWECHLWDEKAYAKYNEKYKYIISVIDVFSKFVFLVPVKTKSGPAGTTAFLSVFDDDTKKTLRRAVWLRTDKGKEFLNEHFQDMLREEGIQFHVCRKPDVKRAMVELAHRKIRDRLYKYFTFKNILRYIDVFSKFVRA